MRTARDGLEVLRVALVAHGGAVADALADDVPELLEGPGPPQLAASGPRTSGRGAEYELLLEMILEGSRLHYGEARLVQTRDDDLALLLGDQLYAMGLLRLAALGDLHAVAELADVISLEAQARTASDRPLASAVWQAGAVAIGWGSTKAYEAAKELARSGDPRAAAELLAAARAAGVDGS